MITRRRARPPARRGRGALARRGPAGAQGGDERALRRRRSGSGCARTFPPGHVRTPHYLRGQAGVVESIAGHFANPEELAYGRDGLPRARALPRALPPGRALARLSRCAPRDSAVVDIFEHWLEPLEEAGSMTGASPIIDHPHADPHPQPARPRGPAVRPLPADGRGGRRAADREGRVRAPTTCAARSRRSTRARRPMARGWSRAPGSTRPSRRALLADVNAAARELGIDAGAIPIRALENTAALHNLVVCTLCSCYPRGLLGLPPDWYKARAYRSRAVREPRAVLAEFGTEIPDEVEIRVHDSTADLRYLVLPLRPAGQRGARRGGARGAGDPRLHDRHRAAGGAGTVSLRTGDDYRGEPARRPRGLDRGRAGRRRPEPPGLQADRRRPGADLRSRPRARARGTADLRRCGGGRAPAGRAPAAAQPPPTGRPSAPRSRRPSTTSAAW